ncbi:MAG: GNAT family N-acetyltransferase [Actinomycetes bacterium]
MQAPTLTDGPVTLRAHRPDDVSFVVEYGGRFAGEVGLRPDGQGAAQLGFGLAPWARGRGLMSAAVRLALTWGFAEAGLTVVHWRAPVGDWASRRVAWACGFRIEGTVRGLETRRGERRDAWIGSILPEDETRPRHPWLEVPRLVGDRVVLRRHVDGDALRIAEACAHPTTQRWLPDLPSPYTVVDAAEYVAGREEQHACGAGLYWAIASPDDDRLLGAVGLMELGGGSRSGEIGYWVHPDARGKGVAAAATRLAARHALLPDDVGGLGLARVTLRAAEPNVASRRTAENAGFTAVGRDRDAERLRDGTVCDFVRYDLLATELRTPP